MRPSCAYRGAKHYLCFMLPRNARQRLADVVRIRVLPADDPIGGHVSADVSFGNCHRSCPRLRRSPVGSRGVERLSFSSAPALYGALWLSAGIVLASYWWLEPGILMAVIL